jgi:hypothetical protein
LAIAGNDTPIAHARKAPRRWRRLLLPALVLVVAMPLLLMALLVLLLYVPPVQHAVRCVLCARLGTRVEPQRPHLRFPLGLLLKGLYVEDQQGDTLLYAGELRTRAGLRKLLGGEPQLRYGHGCTHQVRTSGAAGPARHKRLPAGHQCGGPPTTRDGPPSNTSAPYSSTTFSSELW